MKMLGVISFGVAFFTVTAGFAKPYSTDAVPTLWINAPNARLAREPDGAANWWSAFNDPVLTTLVDKAASSADVEILSARLDAANAGLRRARAALLPEISVLGSANALSQDEFRRDSRASSVDALWSVDLFGSTRARVGAARADAEAAAALTESARLDARAAAARLIITYRTAAVQVETTERAEVAFSDALSLAEARVAAGLSPSIDQAQARATLEAFRPSVAGAKKAMEEARLTLEALLGEEPGALSQLLRARVAVTSPAPTILLAPASMIKRRPDIIAAERKLAAAGLDAKAARRDFLPKLSLAAAFGDQTFDPVSENYPSGPVWSLAANAIAPIISFGRLESNVQSADARTREAAAQYRRTVSYALADVEKALVAGAAANSSKVALENAVRAAREQVDLAQIRYRAGLSSFLEIAIAQAALANAEKDLAAAIGDEAAAFISLNVALGVTGS